MNYGKVDEKTMFKIAQKYYPSDLKILLEKKIVKFSGLLTRKSALFILIKEAEEVIK